MEQTTAQQSHPPRVGRKKVSVRPGVLGLLAVISICLLLSGGVVLAQSAHLARETRGRVAGGQEMYRSKATLAIPDVPWFGRPWRLGSSWIDPVAGRYYLADAHNRRVDVINLIKHESLAPISGGFTGWRDTNGRVSGLGPSGLVGFQGMLAVGNGDGMLKVFNTASGQLLGQVFTGGQGGIGKIASDPEQQWVLAVHGDDVPAFVQLVSVHDPTHPTLVGPPVRIRDASPGTPIWDGAAHRFLLALDRSSGGEISAFAPGGQGLTRGADLPLPCQPGGLAAGPADQLLIGCRQGQAVQVDARSGALITTFPQLPGGIDEVAFDAADGCFYLAADAPHAPVIGVIDTLGQRWQWITNVVAAPGTHDVAVDAATHVVYVPENGLTETGAAYQGLVVLSKQWTTY